ncbi:hypothetical protein BJX64DRAFT_283165 [Aspergillus heterothallicus]
MAFTTPINFFYSPSAAPSHGRVYGLIKPDNKMQPLRVTHGWIFETVPLERIVFVEPRTPGNTTGFNLVTEAGFNDCHNGVKAGGVCPKAGDVDVEGFWVNDQGEVMVGKGRVVWAGEHVHVAWVGEV